jgi:hypothetical protein
MSQLRKRLYENQGVTINVINETYNTIRIVACRPVAK